MKETIIKLAAVVAMVFIPLLATAQWKIGIEGGLVHNTLLVSKCYDYDRHYTCLLYTSFSSGLRYDGNKFSRYGVRAVLAF